MLFSPSCREFNSLQKNIQHVYIGPILFSENKIIQSVVGGKVDGQILFGTRDEKRKNYLAPKDSYEKFYLAVKGLSCFLLSMVKPLVRSRFPGKIVRLEFLLTLFFHPLVLLYVHYQSLAEFSWQPPRTLIDWSVLTRCHLTSKNVLIILFHCLFSWL